MKSDPTETEQENLSQLHDWFREEPLHEDLVPYLRKGPLGQMIHHRFIIEPMFVPILAKRVNSLYVHKSAAAREAMKEERWAAYITYHERPYRLDAFEECVNEGLDGSTYWNLLSMVWTDSENIHEGLALWQEFWSYQIPGRLEHVMDEDERAALAKLPEVIPVWRGCTVEEGIPGMSWTTSKAKAEWFARRFAGYQGRGSHLAHGKVHKDKVLAYLLGRGEHEIIVLPEDVDIQRTTKLKTKRKTL